MIEKVYLGCRSKATRFSHLASKNTRFCIRWMSDDAGPNRDIAFKPAESGWGFGAKYNKNYDSIFSKNVEKETNATKDTSINENKGDES